MRTPWCTHWLSNCNSQARCIYACADNIRIWGEEVPVWVYAFWVCKPVSLTKQNDQLRLVLRTDVSKCDQLLLIFSCQCGLLLFTKGTIFISKEQFLCGTKTVSLCKKALISHELKKAYRKKPGISLWVIIGTMTDRQKNMRDQFPYLNSKHEVQCLSKYWKKRTEVSSG